MSNEWRKGPPSTRELKTTRERDGAGQANYTRVAHNRLLVWNECEGAWPHLSTAVGQSSVSEWSALHSYFIQRFPRGDQNTKFPSTLWSGYRHFRTWQRLVSGLLDSPACEKLCHCSVLFTLRETLHFYKMQYMHPNCIYASAFLDSQFVNTMVYLKPRAWMSPNVKL